MRLFLDSADINEIKDLSQTGLIDGITTNPSIIAKSGRNLKDVIAEICAIIPGSVSAEVISTDYEGMIKEGNELTKIAKNVTIKVPFTMNGVKACKYFADKGISVNVTLIFSANQALLAAKAGADYVSPFIGRIDDISHDGMILIEDIKQIFMNYDFKTNILGASVRHPYHVLELAKVGADVATLPTNIFKQLFNHPLTDIGLEKFLEDWKKSNAA